MQDETIKKGVPEQCSHPACTCESSGIEEDGKSYCSDGCAGGKGCSHDGCNCADN